MPDIKQIRGIRNNNPLNLKRTSISWDGESKTNQDKTFETFTNPYYGIRAGAKLLLNYEKFHKINTVKDLINRFAPPVENNTKSYIESVCKALNLEENETFSIKENITPLVIAIIKHENGFNPYSSRLIKDGIELAL